ncbi:MAG: hypothetical protein LLF94_06545 [Chlamydiales bacterium]|nr:hypothetical protein [Chlamydiales bacterium]
MNRSRTLWQYLGTFAVCLASVLPMQAETPTLRERLANRLPDIDRVDELIENFNRLADKLDLNTETSLYFEDWLLTKSFYIGSKNYDHNSFFRRVPSLQNDKKFNKAFNQFVRSVTPVTAKSDSTDTLKRITLLFTGAYGGGHKAPTMAIQKYLESKGHTVQLIDVDEVENRYSPQIDGYTKADIYAEVYQKQNDPKKAKKLTRKLSKAQKVEDRRHLGDIKESISEFKPHHILAVAHHRPKLAYLSYILGVPMTYIHTDHEFNKMLLPILYEQEKLENPLINFALLSEDKHYKAGQSVVKQLVRVDFPVRESFKPANSKQKAELRRSLNIPYNAYVVKLAMGQNGLAKDMKKILIALKKDKKKLKKKPMYVFVVCGKNEMLKKELKKYAKSKGKLRIAILGFLDEQQMAIVDRSSDVWITKPGGSTSAELLQVQKQMLYDINPAHPWEKTNAKFLESMHLAKKLERKKSLVKQIMSRVKYHKKLNKKEIPKSKWQSQIDAVING